MCRLDAVLTDRQVAETHTPSPEPELELPLLVSAPKAGKASKRRRADLASSEPSNEGTWRASTGTRKSAEAGHDGSEESGDDRWHSKDGAADRWQPEPQPESR